MLGKKNQTLDRAGAPSAALVVILAAALISTSSAQAQTYTYKLLHTFSGAEGSQPNAVTLGAAGELVRDYRGRRQGQVRSGQRLHAERGRQGNRPLQIHGWRGWRVSAGRRGARFGGQPLRHHQYRGRLELPEWRQLRLRGRVQG